MTAVITTLTITPDGVHVETPRHFNADSASVHLVLKDGRRVTVHINAIDVDEAIDDAQDYDGEWPPADPLLTSIVVAVEGWEPHEAQ